MSFQSADKIICVSQGLKDNINTRFGIDNDKIVVIYNGVDLHTISKIKQKKSLKKIIISCGRLVEQKGFTHLIHAFNIVRKSYPEVVLHIIGKGELHTKMTALVSSLKLTHVITLLKYRKPYSHLKQAYIFVSSSLYEGFGNVIIEAMNCGLPIVSTNCRYGPQEILNGSIEYKQNDLLKILYGKWGILVPPIKNGEESMAQALISLLKDKKMYLKYKKASIIRGKQFSADTMSRKLLSEIQSVCK
jgi:glycosyltransferase involved in cell wall biosynthesis